jgi:hypothetical protein
MKQVMKAIAQTAAGVAVALSVAAPAKADVISFFNGTDLVATLTTSAGTDFRLDFLYAPAGPGTAFINDLLLEYTGSLSSLGVANLGGDSAPNATFCGAGSSGCAMEGTDANVKVSWPTSGGGDRFNEGEFSLFRITPTSPSEWDFSRLHINAFLDGESIKLTGSDCTDGGCTGKVPEPATLTLISLALLGAGIALRRRPK